MRRQVLVALVVVCWSAITSIVIAAEPARPAAAQSYPSVLRARDINGLQLGMNFRQVAQRMRLEHLGGGQYEGSAGGVAYDLEFSPLGRLFRIDTQQSLGRFTPDYRFGQQLTAKLAAKYGPPHWNQNDGVRSWSGYATVQAASGQMLRREVETLSAYVQTNYGSGDVTLVMKLMDFRILWSDQAALNQAPRDRGARDATF